MAWDIYIYLALESIGFDIKLYDFGSGITSFTYTQLAPK